MMNMHSRVNIRKLLRFARALRFKLWGLHAMSYMILFSFCVYGRFWMTHHHRLWSAICHQNSALSLMHVCRRMQMLGQLLSRWDCGKFGVKVTILENSLSFVRHLQLPWNFFSLWVGFVMSIYSLRSLMKYLSKNAISIMLHCISSTSW